MKSIAAVFAIIGLCSGVLFALAPWFFGTGNVALASFMFPLGFGVLIMATHWLTFRRILSGVGKRLGLLVPNTLLLVAILLGVLYLPPAPAGNGRPVVGMVFLAAVFLLPLACNVVYLCWRSRSSNVLAPQQ